MNHANRLRDMGGPRSAHRLTGSRRPHNSLYIISDSGQITDRYDKRFCSGDPDETDRRPGPLQPRQPTSASGPSTASAAARRSATTTVTPSCTANTASAASSSSSIPSTPPSLTAQTRPPRSARPSAPRFKRYNPAATHTYPGITMPAAMTTAAACNHMWISCPNSSAPESCWAAFFVRADGITTGRLRRNTPESCYPPPTPARNSTTRPPPGGSSAIDGTLHSGTPSLTRAPPTAPGSDSKAPPEPPPMADIQPSGWEHRPHGGQLRARSRRVTSGSPQGCRCTFPTYLPWRSVTELGCRARSCHLPLLSRAHRRKQPPFPPPAASPARAD